MTSLDLCRGGDSIHARKHPRAYITSRKQKKRSTQILPSPKAFRRCFRWQRYEPTVQPICAMEDNYLFFSPGKKGKMGASVKKQCQVRNTKTWMNSLKSMKAESCSSTRERGNFCFFWHRISLANRNGTAAYPSWRNPHDHRFKQVHTQWTEMPGSTPAYNTREGDKRQICNHRIAFRETQDKYTIQNNEESKTDMAEYANLAVPVVYKSAEDFDKYNKQSDKKH